MDNDPRCRIQEELVPTTVSNISEVIWTFEIRNTKTSDAGTYSVHVYNKNGSDSCSAVVTVLRKLSCSTETLQTNIEQFTFDISSVHLAERSLGSSVPKFITELTNTSAFLGDTITLKAEVEGFPEPQIRWFKDGRMLVVGGRFTTTASDNGSVNRLTCRLDITNCQIEDTGAYVCAATSASGTAISEAAVIVKGIISVIWL